MTALRMDFCRACQGQPDDLQEHVGHRREGNAQQGRPATLFPVEVRGPRFSTLFASSQGTFMHPPTISEWTLRQRAAVARGAALICKGEIP
jgi:hypothetical protein